ncbi:MAG: DUF2283 domain-containing protein [Candidatus Binatia bacterium]
MKISYDPEVDALYIRFVEEPVGGVGQVVEKYVASLSGS